jgi:type VI secretion system protein ImpI
MPLTLQLVNEKTLPDGGPVSIQVSGKHGIDIGRAAHLDWTLPDPTRYISSKHCEIRYRDGGYWLHDVSTNGTFLNGADHRMHEPHRLKTGDRFLVGQYIVGATVEGEEDNASANASIPQSAPAIADQDWWLSDGQVPPPIDPKDLRAARSKLPVNPDFLDWAADVPDTFNEGLARSASSLRRDASALAGPDMDWATGPPSRVPAPPPAPPPVPAPRRPDRENSADNAERWREPVRAEPAPDAAAWGEIRRLESHDDDTVPFGAVARPAEPQAQAPLPLAPAVGRDSFASQSAALEDFIQQLAAAAGLPPEMLAQKHPSEVAEQMGSLVRLAVENLMQLLSARQQAKQLAHTGIHTIVQATDNNPLKFCPSAQDALRIMFGPANAGYLDAHRAIVQGFEDVKGHQVKTFAAMQHALSMIMADLDPKTIDRETQGKSGLGRLPQMRKAKLWDAFEARWQAKVERKGGEPVEAFMRYFADFYDRKN